MDRRILTAAATAVVALPAGLADAARRHHHNPGCKTPQCEVRVGRWWYEHHHHHRPAPPRARPRVRLDWSSALASEYGHRDGTMGGPLKCGGRLTESTLGVANRTLPCGTMVTFAINGRSIRVPVVDRGPYCCGRDWDLTVATAEDLGLGDDWSGSIDYAIG